MNANIERLRSLIENVSDRLRFHIRGTLTYNKLNAELDNLETDLRLALLIQSYRNMLTMAHLKVLRTLNEMIVSGHDDFLVRKAYAIAYYGCVCSALFERTDFQDLKPFFPSLKLPLTISFEDEAEFKNQTYRNIQLEVVLRNVMIDFRANPNSKSTDQLRTMFWAPILKAIFNSLKLDFLIEDLFMIAGYDAANIPEFQVYRFVDIVVVPNNPDGLPILLVEISSHPVPEGIMHKDFWDMANAMIYILMEKIKRAEVHCPDGEFTNFRVYGLLIAAYDFEFCVGTVVKDESGRINFMFHINTMNWKFSFKEPISSQSIVANDFICSGDVFTVGKQSELVPGIVEEDPSTIFCLPCEINPEEEEEPDVPIPDFEFVSDAVQTPQIVLWKFIRAMMKHYNDLPLCLKECIKTKPIETSSVPSRYNHLPKDLLPTVAPSRSDHGRLLAQLVPEASNVQKLIETEAMARMYSTLIHTRIPNLPKVIVFEEAKRQCTVQEHNYGIYEYCADFVKIPDRKRSVKSCLSAKFILDMLIAAYQLHKRGLVCGAFISNFTRYDGMYWYLKNLSRARTVKEAEEFGIPRFTDPSEASFHLQPPQIMSQRDDLYGIIQTFMRNFHGTFIDAIYESSYYPLFDRFKVETYSKMNNFDEYPDVTVEDILSKAIPAYNNLIDGTVLTGEFVRYQMSLEATKLLANEVLREISGRRGSISMHSIHSTTSESSEEKNY